MKTLHTIYTSFAKRLVMLLMVLMTISVGTSIAQDELVYTLTPASGSNNSYTGNCDITISGIKWNLTGNSTTQPWRIGGKSLTKVDRTLYSKTAITDDISKIVITHGAANSITVNSMTVIVSTSENGGGTVISTLTPTFSANGDVTITRPDGKEWSKAFYKIVYNVTVSSTSNKFIEFTSAKFYKTTAPSTFSVTYDANGASGAVPTDDSEYESGATVTAKSHGNLVKEGFSFAGWKRSDNSYIVQENTTFTMPASNLTLTAQWTAKALTNYRTTCTEPSTFTVTYNGNGNTSGSVPEDNTEYEKDAQVTVLGNTGTLAKTGYAFSGWNTETNGTGTTYAAGDKFTITENTTLYAKWTAKTATSLSWSAATYSATIDADNTFPTLTILPNDLIGVTYSSSNTSVATIDANTGDITLKADGTTTITATFTETATHTDATASYTLTVNPSNCRWVETEIGDIDSGDEVVITMTLPLATSYALPNDVKRDGVPSVQIVDIEDNSIQTVSNSIIWIINKEGDNLTFESYANKNNFLTCNNANDGVRVNTGANKTFVVDDTYGYLKNTQTDRYLGVHNEYLSWYSYALTNTGNFPLKIVGQTLKFYKRECLDATKVWVEGNLTNVTCSPQLPQQLAKNSSLELKFTAADGYELPNNVTVTNATTSWNQATGILTISNPKDNVMVTVEAVKYYTVTWKPAGGNWSGDTNDKVVKYEAGDKIVAPATPIYDCHEFLGWTPAYLADMTMPAENLEFTATWNKLSYTITFKNYDGTVLQTSTVECGETPSYTGATPTREQTAQYTYTFKDWSPTIAPATKDQVYTAQFNQTTRSYTVIWYDGTGNAHKTQTANYNATVALPTTNPDPCDDEYPHFIGWTADPITGSTTTQPVLVENVKVTGDCDYYAVFAKGEAGGGGSYVLDYTAENLGSSNKWGSYGTAYTHTAKDGSTWVIKAYKSSGMQINTGKNASIKIPSCPSPITSIEITGSTAKAVGLSASDYTGSGTITYIVTGQDNKSQTLDFAGKNVTNGYIVAKSGSISITKITVNFTAPTNYTSFITTCCTSWSAPTLTYTTPLEENGTAMPQLGAGTTHGTVTYASSNPSILSVNPTTGQISAQAPGTATVTATWSGDETYCSASSKSNVITVKGSFSVIFKANGGTGTMANQKADENNKIAQLNANQFTRTGYAFVGWNTSSYGTGTAYTDQQTNITLAQNLTLYAQWAPIVTLNDAGNEETAHPTAVNGTITLPDGANACDPYEFVGWTSVAIADWNEGINEPALVATTYKPSASTTLYAVYKIQSEGNANAFKLSFEGGNGKTYYVGEYDSSPYLRGFSNITEADAVTFIRKKMYPNDDTKYYLYLEHLEEYLYCSSGNLYTTSSEPSESQGWVFHTVGDKIQIQAINQERYLSYSDRDDDRINITTHSTGSQESFNMLSAVTSTYVASPLCNQEIEIIFETGNGDFVDNAPATNPLTVSRGDVITLPTCEYPGYEFMGWLKDEQQLDPSDIIGTYYTGDYTVDGVSSTITFYAYYKAIPEEVEFTGTDDAELLMYYYDGTENYYYSVSHGAERGELSSKQNCFNATTWTFTNVGNMQYHIQDETGKYLGAVSNTDNDLSLSNTPKVWNFTLVNGLWKMVCEDSPSRALMYISTGKKFANAAISNEGNGAYSYITLGICPYPTYTTNPVLSQGFSITNTAMVTSASGQKVKATSALTLETRNIELPCTFTISAPNITFYDNTGAEVTQLTSSAASEQFELYFAYKPTAENTMEYPTITITDDELKTYTIKNRIYARSLPNTFAVVAKVGGIWYALPSQGLNSTTPPAAYPVEVDNMADPTAVAAVPANADWSLRQVYEASRVDATKDRFVANGENLVFVNNASPAMALNASVSGNYVLTDAQYANYYQTNPGLYEWTPTTTDLETYQLTNGQRSRTLSVNTATVFGVHATDKAVEQVRFLPIQNRYIPAALQVVEWKENSVVIMYNGDPAQTASVSVNGGAAQNTTLSAAQRDIAVYELTATGLAANPTQRLSITIGTEKVILPIPYIISGSKTDYDLLPGSSVSAKREAAKVSDLVILKEATLTAAGTNKNDPYKFRHVTIYGGGKLVIPENNSFGVASLTLRAGGITDAGDYDYVYPQFDLRGTFINSAAKINYDYITDYEHWYHLVLPFAGELGTIKYPTEFYGANVTADNKGSWQIKRYAGEIRATGNYNAWVDIETEGKTSTIAGQGYIFWGAPKKLTVNGETTRQKWGIQRITMSVTADDAETEKADKILTGLSSHEDVANNSEKDNDQGWNLIGNPYMVNLTDMATTGLHACKLVEVIDPTTGMWNGKWEWNNETNIRYLTIPSDHFDTYTAKTVAQTVPLVAGRAFFVQLEGEANGITFAAANRASLMPALLAENSDKPVDIETGIILSNETLQDEVNFWIKDGKTNDYEYNADYPKTPNNNYFNIYGVHTNGDLSWVAISPELAAESMPIGYQVPAAGTYTLSVSETYYSDDLHALYVTDHAMSPELTVDLMNAPYEFSVNQAETNNERFTISLILKSENQGPTTDLENIGVMRDKPMKFIYKDKIYIYNKGTIYDATGKQVTTINK